MYAPLLPYRASLLPQRSPTHTSHPVNQKATDASVREDDLKHHHHQLMMTYCTVLPLHPVRDINQEGQATVHIPPQRVAHHAGHAGAASGRCTAGSARSTLKLSCEAAAGGSCASRAGTGPGAPNQAQQVPCISGAVRCTT